MTVFIDTGVFYSFFNTKDPNHFDSVALLTHVVEGKFGHPFTSDYVMLEGTVLLQRRMSAAVSLAFVDFVSSNDITAFPVGAESFEDAMKIYKKEYERLSLCDSATIVAMDRLGISRLASYDNRSFSGFVPHIVGRDYFQTLSEEERSTIEEIIRRRRVRRSARK